MGLSGGDKKSHILLCFVSFFGNTVLRQCVEGLLCRLCGYRASVESDIATVVGVRLHGCVVKFITEYVVGD